MCQKGNYIRCMQSDVARVLAGKRVLLLGDLMRESGFPDADEITNKIAGGFDVVGALSPSGAFSPQPRTEASSVGALWRGSKAMQRTVIDSMRPSGDDALDAAVTTITEDEVANGWLAGPWTEEQLSDKLWLWIPVPRFGVKQGEYRHRGRRCGCRDRQMLAACGTWRRHQLPTLHRRVGQHEHPP